MATRFVRIDLSDGARDFRPLAIEPGLAMLDKGGANARILFRWIGGMAAEPVWEGECVHFYVRDDRGGRLEEVLCQPADELELRGSLKDEIARLRERVQHARAETPSERAFHKIVLRTLADLLDNPDRTDLGSYFFRYRDVENRWRLVWCWGYQRVDQEQAPAVICTDPDCALLFVRRPKRDPKCPACAAAMPLKKRKKSGLGVLLALLLLLLLAALSGWMFYPESLTTAPGSLAGPVGSRFELKVAKNGLFGNRDVTGKAAGTILDPAVAAFDPATGVVRFTAPGETVLHVQLGKLTTDVLVTSMAAPKPEQIAVQPIHVKPPEKVAVQPPRPDAPVEVAILSDQGQTVSFPVGGEFGDFRVEARYRDGLTRLVTKKAALRTPEPPQDAPLAAAGGKLIGVRPGRTSVTAEFDGVQSKTPLEAVVSAGVDADEIRVAPTAATLLPGETLPIRAIGYKNGKSIGDISRAGKVAWQSDNEQTARVDGTAIAALRPGEANIAARFGSLTSQPAKVKVVEAIAAPLRTDPKTIRLRVGEAAQIGEDVSIFRGDADVSEQCKMTSLRPDCVRCLPETQSLVGVSTGTSQVAFALGDKSCNLIVEVAPAEAAAAADAWSELRIEPKSASIYPGEALRYETTAVKGGQRRVLGKEDGVQLSVSNGTVAEVLDGAAVGAVRPGKTSVIAMLGPQTAEANLEVAPGKRPAADATVIDGGVIYKPGDVYYTGDGGFIFGRDDVWAALRRGVTVYNGDGQVVVRGSDGELQVAPAPAARLIVSPENLSLWKGETGKLSSVSVDPGGGKAPIPVEYKLTVPADQTTAAVEGNSVRGLAPGTTPLTVATVDPKFPGLSATVSVQVFPPDKLSIDPPDIRLQVGKETPPVTVSVRGADGQSHPVEAVLESEDPTVLAPSADHPGRFLAKGPGQTHLQASYRGAEALVPVTVAGKRFAVVRTSPEEGKDGFDVQIDVEAAVAEGPLEYRVYAAGETPPENWVSNQPHGENRLAVLRSSPMAYGPPGTMYHLMIESRDAATKTVQQYPLTFRAKVSIEREENQ